MGSTTLKNMTYLWCQTTHQGNQLPWELRYSIKPVWIRLWEQQTPFKSFHISKQRKPLDHRAILMAYAEQMSRKLLMQDLETHLLTNHTQNEKWSQRTWQWQWLPYWRGNMTPRRERCVGKITSPLGTTSSTYIHVYTQIMYGFISPWNYVLSR